ncbi:myopalladin isoform X1 [Scleropages formosus]|uniref:Myopalladin n=1 Tax=Scleropages formosus TaxID=113540 RepID=A0A8C9SYZ8_SCLFO|nr:myopalladin isoform X1 [Scleropages formosus]
MQENNLEPSISQLLRESYFADANVHQRQCEMSRSDGTSHHLVYGGLLGKSEDVGGQDDFPDLSAFLSQEELDKSVNLARQAIGQGNHEERAEDMGLGGKPVSHKSRPPIDKREVPVSHPTSPDQQTFQPASKENVIKNNRPQKEPIQDFRKPVRNTPYGPETQSKKEFLNKAADFIEELSSLFKANSSKRIRPRACKAHRSRYKMKTQQDGSAFNAQDRERPIPPYTSQPDEQTEPPMEEEPELSLSKNSIQDESFDVDADEAESHQAKAPSPSQPQHSEGPIMEPPHFIQKLKSREVPEGSKVRLDCIVRGLPTPEVRWFCEGKELENSPDIQIITDGELHSLIIAEAFEEDTGRYSCFASNFYGTDSTSAEIYVEGASSSDSDAEQHFEHVTQAQKKSPLSVQVVPPAPRLPPAREEEPVPVPVPIAVSVPIPAPVDPPSLQTPKQEASAPAAMQNAMGYPQGLDGRPLMAAPVFTKNLQDLIAFEGQLVVLECRVKGVPSPRVEWYREGTMIEDSPDFRILQKKPRSMAESEEICTLVIAEVFPEDSGTFTCTAKNKYGTVSSIAYLKVKGNETSSTNMKAGTSLTVEPSHYHTVELLPPEPTNSSQKSQVDAALMSCNKAQPGAFPLDSLSGGTKPVAEGDLIHHKEPLPNIHPTDPFSASLKPRLDNKPIHHAESLNVAFSDPLDSSPKPILENNPAYQNIPPCSILLSNSLNSGLKPRLEGSLVSEPLPSILSTDSLKPRMEGTALPHNEPRYVVLPPDPYILKPTAEEALVYPTESRSSTMHPTITGLSLKPKMGATGPTQVESQPSLIFPDLSLSSKTKPDGALFNHNESRPNAVPLDTPSSCLKPKLVSQNESRANSRVGLRVHFKLPEDDLDSVPSEESTPALEMHNSLLPGDTSLTSPSKEPPPVLAKPKLDQHQLQILHNQVLLEQQQESTPPTLLDPAPWPPRLYHEQKSSPINLPNLPTSTFTPAATPTPASMTQSFNYTRPKEFIAAAQSLSPVRSLSPTESPVPMLNAMAAKMQQRPAADASFLPPSPAPNQFAPSPRMFPTRVLQSPTSPPGFVSSPTMVPPALLNSAFARRPQSPPQAPSPTSSSSTPSPIQNPVAFLSSVLPSLPASPPTNEMGLPKGAPLVSPQGMPKKIPKPLRSVSDDDIREGKETVLQDLEKKLRLRQESANNGQQKLPYEGKTAARLLGPNNPATVINYDEEYKVSNFEQRLMGEIEFRLERTPVEESDDEVQHDEIPTGKCIAPVFDKKLKNFRAMEGVPVTFTCKVVGIPIPKVYWFKDGKQILKKNEHYKRTREGDGTCSLHIEATTSDDDGNYTVMAANPQGRNSCSGHLIVQTGPFRGRLTPLIHSQRVRSRVQEVEEGEPVHERFFQPHFLQAPGDMVAHEGRLCRLDCKVSGLPNPDLMWLLKGRQIFPDLRHRMLVRENGVHSLLIDPLMQSDAGTYTCIATNKAGQSSFSLELNVMEKEVKKVPMFLERLQNTGIAEGNPVRLECRVAGMPPPVIYWKKDNDTISPNKDRVSMHQDATGYVCLLIQPTRKEDAGWYTVSAKNEAGIVSCTARLDIYAQWHQQIPQPTKIVRPSGSRYAALTIQGLDIMSAFPTTDNSPILFASSPVEAALESDEL